jgi:hypothetical protein
MTAIGVEQVMSQPARASASAANDTPRTARSRVFDDFMLARLWRNSRLGGPCASGAGAVIGAVVNIERVGRQSDEEHRRLTAPDSW